MGGGIRGEAKGTDMQTPGGGGGASGERLRGPTCKLQVGGGIRGEAKGTDMQTPGGGGAFLINNFGRK